MAKTILVVDDEEDIRHMLRLILEKSGFVVETAGDGQEALDQVRDHRPDLILLDLKMPRLNGYEVFVRLKSDEQFKTIPIIVVTAVTQDSDQEDEEWARRMGAEGFVTKPFDLSELGRRIEELISKLI